MAHKKQRSLPQDPTFWDRLSPLLQHSICLGVLFLVPLFLFPETIIGDKQFFAHDTLQWRAAAQETIEYRKTHSDEPLWIHNMFSGMPAYVVSYVTSVPHLDTLLLRLFQTLFPLFPYLILLSGAYVLGLALGLSPLAATWSALGVSLTTYIPIIIGAGHNSKFITYSWVPWSIATFIFCLRPRFRWIYLAGFALCMNFQLRSGHPQVTYYFTFLLLAIWLVYTVQQFKEGELKTQWLPRNGLLLLASVLVIAANVQPLWSIAEYSPFSIRGGSALASGLESGLNQNYAMAWSQGWGELGTLLIPNLYGGGSALGTYWGPKSVTSGPHYLGALIALLAFLALFVSTHRFKWAFFGAGLLGLLFSLGENFMLLNALMFDFFPGFNKFRTPEMWLILTALSWSTLAGLALQEFTNRTKKPSFEQVKTPLIALIALVFLFVISPWAFLSYEKEGERIFIAEQVARQNNITPENPAVQRTVNRYISEQLAPAREQAAKSDALRFLIITCLGFALFALYWRENLSFPYLTLSLIALSTFDLISVGNRYTAKDALVAKSFDQEQVLRSRQKPLDRWIAQRNEQRIAPWRVFPLAENPFNNALPSFSYPSIGGYSGAKLSIYQDLIENALFTKTGMNDAVMDMLGVRYVIHQSQVHPDYLPVFRDEQWNVYENDDALEKAFFVDSISVVGSARQAMEALQDFNPKKIAIVEYPMEQTVFESDSLAHVEITTYDPRAITLKTVRAQPGFLVLSEIYYPAGWQAFVDGQETPIFKTNYVLRGIQVSQGEHEIRFEFNPRSHVLGSQIAWFGNVCIMLLLVGGFFLDRKDD